MEAESDEITTGDICNLFGQAFLIAFFFGLLILSLSYAVYKLESKSWKFVWDWLEGHLAQMFTVIWVFGFCVYAVGMFLGVDSTLAISDRFGHLLGITPMAIIHAFGMFIFESDISVVYEEFHNNLFYMILYSAAHFLAACVSLVFVIKHFGYNIVASIEIWLASHSFTKYSQVFIFWGMNDASFQLAKSIKTCGKVEGKYLTIIIRMSDDDKKVEESSGLGRLFNFLSMKNVELEKIKDLGCHTTSSYTSLAKLSESRDDKQQPDILRKRMRLNSIVKIIKKTSGDIHMFFLSDDDKANIQSVGNIKRDITINEIAAKHHGKIKLYCHARYNSVHRVIEDEQKTPNVQVKVVDSSHISVELMKQKIELQPVNYVKIEKDATISSSFNALIIGFSEVGLDALRFLYEFGAFVKTGSTKEWVERAPFHCDVIDKKMDELAGLFVANAPSIPVKCSFQKSIYPLHPLITLHKMDGLSLEFTRYLEEHLKNDNPLNYIVVATENDEQNISIGVRILRMAIRYRKDMKHMRIMVRVHHDEDKHILHIVEHYNRLWAANGKSTDKDHKHQKTIATDEKIDYPITLFGFEDSTYTYENIISEEIEEEAKRYKAQYDNSVNEQRAASGQDVYPPQTWDEEQNEYMQLEGEFKGFSPTFSGVMRLRRIQSQNKENSLHRKTKQELFKAAFGEDTASFFSRNKISRDTGTLTYWQENGNHVEERLQRLLDVLAWTEHLRWNASHEVLGYRTCKENGLRDEARLIHWCLRPWQDLNNTETESYDYDVVDVSLGII